MKAAVADEAKRTSKWGRKPDERYAQCFRWAIGRAIHYAHVCGVTLNTILNDWEEKRTYKFISYYSNHHFPKLHNNTRKPVGLRACIKAIRKDTWYSQEKNGRVCSEIMRFDAIKRKQRDKKPRWTPEYRRRIKRRGY